MSDEQELNGLFRALLKKSIFFIAGGTLFLILYLISLANPEAKVKLLGLISWAIVGFPLIWIVIRGGGLAGAFSPSYEVVTTHSDGSRSSDGGAQSMQSNLILIIGAAFVVYAVGGIVTILHIIILSVRFITAIRRTDERPAFIKIGFIIMAINLAITAGFVGSVIHDNARGSAANAKYAKEQKARAELTQVTFPAGITFIDRYAYKGGRLTSVTIPEGVTDIGSGAFQGCVNLTSVTLPRSLERIGGNVFEGCTSLVDVIIPSGHTIKYGSHSSGTAGGASPVESLRAYTDYYYFKEGNEFTRAFIGCTSLSAASQQAIKDSGYKFEF